MSLSDDIRVRLGALAEGFLRELPIRIDEIAAMATKALGDESSAESLADLRRHVHKLAGSAATFGHHDIAAQAKQLEQRLDKVIADERLPDESELETIRTLVSELSETAKIKSANQPTEDIVEIAKRRPSLKRYCYFCECERKFESYDGDLYCMTCGHEIDSGKEAKAAQEASRRKENSSVARFGRSVDRAVQGLGLMVRALIPLGIIVLIGFVISWVINFQPRYEGRFVNDSGDMVDVRYNADADSLIVSGVGWEFLFDERVFVEQDRFTYVAADQQSGMLKLDGRSGEDFILILGNELVHYNKVDPVTSSTAE